MRSDATTLPQAGEQPTMTTVEIAERTGKEHKNVLADARRMLLDLGLRSAEFSANVPDKYGRDRDALALPKRECLILVSGYSVELRAAIIDRWQELEQAQAPRILDTDLAKALGMERPTNVRTRIKGMLIDLKKLGHVALVECNVSMPNGGIKRATAYYLNEEQATLLVMAIKTLKAKEVKLQIVRVFTAWRRGQLQPVQPSLPNFADPIEAAKAFIVAETGRRPCTSTARR